MRNEKKKYIIWAPSLKDASGGVIVLHKLAHLIKSLNYEAYLWPADNNFELFLSYSKYNVPLAEESMIDDNTIVVYPEIVTGNPLNAKYVVRWLLNKPGFWGGDGIYGKHDLIFYFSNAFVENSENVNYLYLMEFFGDLYKNHNLERSESCYTLGKRFDRKMNHDISKSIEITKSTPIEDTVRIFNTTKFFVSYDEVTFLSFQAALCGCISIVVPIPGLLASEWISQDSIRKYGIAYGEENIDHAVNTLDKVHSNMKNLEAKFFKNVENFIIKTQDWASSKNNGIENYQPSTDYTFRKSESQMLIAEELIENGELLKAKEVLNKIRNNPYTKIKVLNHLSTISILEKNYDDAEKTICEILQIDGKNEVAQDNYEYLNEINLITTKKRQ